METTTIIKKLKAKGSEIVRERMLQPGGELFCASYIRANIEKHKCTFDEALGWLEQELAD